MIKGFHHVALDTDKYDLSYKFYTEVLGFKEKISWHMDEDHRAVMLDAGNDNILELFEKDSVKERNQGYFVHIALNVDSTDEVFKKVKEYGAEITMEPEEVKIEGSSSMSLRIAFFKGPNGELFELVEKKEM